MKREADHRELVFVGRALLVGLALVCMPPGPSVAADVNELIKEAVALRRRGNDLGALERLQQAFQIDKGPRVVAQIGLAEQALGRWVQAHDHLTQALDARSIRVDRHVGEDVLAVVCHVPRHPSAGRRR